MKFLKIIVLGLATLSVFVGARSALAKTETIELEVPIGDKTAIEYETNQPNSLLVEYINTIYDYLKIVVATLAAVMIVFNGVSMVLAGGDAGQISAAKERMLTTILGLVLFIVAGLVLYAINPEAFPMV